MSAHFTGVRYGHPITKAAIEIALFDALGKLYRIPLCRLLGGPYRREIELVGGLGMDLGPKAIAARARSSSSKRASRLSR